MSYLSVVSGWVRRVVTPVRALLGGIFLVVTWVWSTASIKLYTTFHQGLDLLIFSQAADSMAHGYLPYSTAKGPHYMLFTDHFHPIIFVLVPLWWIWPNPQMLLVAQAACIGIASTIAAACAIGARPEAGTALTGTSWPLRGLVAGAAMAVAPGIQSGGLFAFHEVALGVPLLAMVCWSFVRRDPMRFFLWSLPLLLVKEDSGVIVVGLGIAAICVGWRRLGGVMMAGGALWTLLCLKVFIPLMRGSAWDYQGMVPSTLSSIWANLWHNLFGNNQFGWILILLIVCCGASSITSPLVVAIIPNVLTRCVTEFNPYLGLEYHYNMLINVITVFAALDAGFRRRWFRKGLNAIIMVLGLGMALGGGQLINTLAGPVDPHAVAAGNCAVAAVPKGVGVVTDWTLGPHLMVDHDPVYELHHDSTGGVPAATGDLPAKLYPDMQWMIVDINGSTKEKLSWGDSYVAEAKQHGWQQTARCETLIVLHRDSR